MNVLCVDQDRTKLRQMKRDAKEIVPDARIAACRDPSRAERLAREKGCDVLLTDTVFDGLNWDGVMLAERIQRVNPRVNIIFITDHADTSAAYDAWQIGASRFSLGPMRNGGWQRRWQIRALRRNERFGVQLHKTCRDIE